MVCRPVWRRCLQSGSSGVASSSSRRYRRPDRLALSRSARQGIEARWRAGPQPDLCHRPAVADRRSLYYAANSPRQLRSSASGCSRPVPLRGNIRKNWSSKWY